ncbi:MAG: metal ABC transporter permease [Chloroflexi bacterium]|nr:metal ABC transporter permease [Chloroflexota bacterium]
MNVKSMSAEDKRVWLTIVGIVVLGICLLPIGQWLFGIRYTYTVRVVALGGSILGVISGALGCFAVLRRESLMGDALSHAALPGVAVAFLLAGRDLGVLLIGAGIASWIALRFISALLSTTRLKQDAAMGIVLASWFAGGIALLAYIQSIPDASQAGLDRFIFGQAAAIIESDVLLISGAGAAVLLALGLFWKEFKLVTFDEEFAGANGFQVGLINTLLSTLIVIAIVLGLQLAGVILMVGMLIAPGIAARQWTQKLNHMVILAAFFGAFAGGVGAVISAIDADIPTGPMIIVVAFLLVMASITLAPGRGLLWSSWRRRLDSRRFARQNALRDLHRYALSHGSSATPVPDAFMRGIGDRSAALGLRQLLSSGLVETTGDSWRLTDAGVMAARRDAHSLQLWDLYRLYADDLGLPLYGEDRQLDIRDVLPADVIGQLEAMTEERPD